MTQQDQQSSFNFVTPELTHRVELILHLLEYSNHVVIVKGEPESGKTTLCDGLLDKAESNLILRKLSVSAYTNENDILNVIINGAIDEKEQQLGEHELNQWLMRCQNKQQVPAVLIDNVDLLTDELINYLFKLLTTANDDTTALHVCLFCEPTFLQRLEEPGIEQDDSRSLHIIEMPGLTEKQTEQYIKSKYPSDEISDLSLFDDKTIKQIHRISHGLPGRVNALCEQYLDDPARKETDEIKEKKSINLLPGLNRNKNIIIVVVLLLMLSVGVATLLNQTETTHDEKQTIKLSLPEQKQDTELKELAMKEDFPEPVPVAEPEPVTIEELSKPVIPALAQDAENPNPDEVIVLDNPEDEQVPHPQPEKTPEPVSETPPVQEQPEEEPPAQEQAVSVATEETDTAVEPEPEPAVVVEQKKDINWLIKQNPNFYVLQLIGANEPETIDFYLKSFDKDDDKIIAFNTTNKGKPWHVLVYGLFENRQQAVMAIDKLPQNARKMDPWPRTVDSIQKLLKGTGSEE